MLKPRRMHLKGLLRLRLERGLTQRQVAEAVGVSIGAVSKYERCLRKPTPEVADKILTLLHCSIVELFGFRYWDAPGPESKKGGFVTVRKWTDGINVVSVFITGKPPELIATLEEAAAGFLRRMPLNSPQGLSEKDREQLSLLDGDESG